VRRLRAWHEALQADLEPEGELFGAGISLQFLGQQKAGFEISEPRRHHQIIGRDLEPELLGIRDEVEILLYQRQDRDFRQIHLLRARKRQQKVERPFPAVDIERQPVRLGDRPLFLEEFPSSMRRAYDVSGTLRRDSCTSCSHRSVMLNLFQHPSSSRTAGGDMDPETSSG
jgi:hypothetical protein